MEQLVGLLVVLVMEPTLEPFHGSLRMSLQTSTRWLQQQVNMAGFQAQILAAALAPIMRAPVALAKAAHVPQVIPHAPVVHAVTVAPPPIPVGSPFNLVGANIFNCAAVEAVHPHDNPSWRYST